ncbi:S8 family peptidase [Zooshikella ganghwensis]|uniref:S8 family peptidase n=1 Tax=Zooshikella ganghwensis TaxID=202772 RepID=UPI0004008929|nr:S8 family serine peptidase [Zooshikella ganghwensis]
MRKYLGKFLLSGVSFAIFSSMQFAYADNGFANEKTDVLFEIKQSNKASVEILDKVNTINDFKEGLLALRVEVSTAEDTAATETKAQGVINSIAAPNFNATIDKNGTGFYIITTVEGLAEIIKSENVLSVNSAISKIQSSSSNSSSSYVYAPDAAKPAKDYTGKGITVAVIDSGVNTNHPQIKGKIVKEYCFLSPDTSALTATQLKIKLSKFGKDYGGCPNGKNFDESIGASEDENGHGSNVTGIIAAQPSTTKDAVPRGSAPGVNIVSMKVTNAKGRSQTQDIVSALRKLATDPALNDVKVINLSITNPGNIPEDCDNMSKGDYQGLINQLVSQGKTFVAGSGNNGYSTGEGFPSCLSSTISVAAHSATTIPGKSSDFYNNYKCVHPNLNVTADEITCFSNVGPSTDIVAPGVNVNSIYKKNGSIVNTSAKMTGTSQATPAVSACVARMLEKDPTLTPAAIKNYLQNSGKYITKPNDKDFYIPKMDCDAAIDMVNAMVKKA